MRIYKTKSVKASVDSRTSRSISSLIRRFVNSNENSIRSSNGRWEIGKGGYDLWAEIYHDRVPVCGIIYDIDTFNVESYDRDSNDIAEAVADALKQEVYPNKVMTVKC